MEYGFYNPERGYWQTTGEPPNHILDGYPEGTIEVPLKPGPHHEWVNGAWVERPTPPAFATYEEASSAMIQWIDAITGQINSQYPSSVQAGWADEEEMARAHLARTATQAQTDILTADASSRGRTPTEHAEAIVGNADKLRSILTEVRKHWLAADTALKAVTDPYDYEQVLEGARAKTSPLAAQFGLKAG